MAMISTSLIKLPTFSLFTQPQSSCRSSSFSSPSTNVLHPNPLSNSHNRTLSHRLTSGRYSTRDDEDDEETEAVSCSSFGEAVALFNERDYYTCHDHLEVIWNDSQEPARTLVHGILQCAVGFHHLFNQNHKGAMMELGEGLCKLRKMNLESGPFHRFEKEISAVLDFIYLTQLELAACTDDFCLAMDQTERSYKLLGGYAAGQRLYSLESDGNEVVYIVFSPGRSYSTNEKPRVKLPTLHASKEHLTEYECI
ncbi:hypothetical protein RJ639_029231 [Escallonia herrerae]|uniref:DUF309 domain-containing protein n=1 Tax=Escallonia herrerae TaxID=1293975 RepID=A0AA88X3W5_9ASTE|nr:hypothetical protein RJ639_029231 [Escallonia herrerae]